MCSEVEHLPNAYKFLDLIPLLGGKIALSLGSSLIRAPCTFCSFDKGKPIHSSQCGPQQPSPASMAPPTLEIGLLPRVFACGPQGRVTQ